MTSSDAFIAVLIAGVIIVALWRFNNVRVDAQFPGGRVQLETRGTQRRKKRQSDVAD